MSPVRVYAQKALVRRSLKVIVFLRINFGYSETNFLAFLAPKSEMDFDFKNEKCLDVSSRLDSVVTCKSPGGNYFELGAFSVLAATP
jgi:hypothetical protein